jgi:hypothetical protein
VIAVIAVCALAAVLGFLLPRLSRRPERGARRTLGAGAAYGSRAPGLLGRILGGSFRSGSRALSRSGSAGRRTRGRLPF